MQSINVKVDRITVAGTLLGKTLADIHEMFGLALKDGAFYLEREDADGNVENMAFMAENAFQRDSWRLDFNPANLTDYETLCVSKVIKAMDKAHFTRLDVAFDLINIEHAMDCRLYRFNVREDIEREIRGRDKSLQTYYWGARKSEQQVRLYDKLVEQKAKHKSIPAGVESWARLELQLRGKRPVDWLKSAGVMLDEFKLADLHVLPLNQRAMMYALINGIIEWHELGSKTTQAKYRKMIRESQGFSTELAEQMKRVLAARTDELNHELRVYLQDWNIPTEK